MKVQSQTKSQPAGYNPTVTVLDVPGVTANKPAEVVQPQDKATPAPSTFNKAPETLSAGRGAAQTAFAYAGTVQAAEAIAELPTLLKPIRYTDDELSWRYRSSTRSRVALELKGFTRDWQVHSPADIDDLLGMLTAELVNKYNHAKRDGIQTAEHQRRTAAAAKLAADYQVVANGHIQRHLLNKKFSGAEAQELLNMVADGKTQFARQMAGDGIDIPAIHAALGTDYRTAADAWAEQATASGHCSFSYTPLENPEAPVSASGTSFNMSVQPGGKWILSVWTDSGWYPVQASPAARAAALQERAEIDRMRNIQARMKPYIGEVFADELQY
ncbi:hypothetical protein [Serratia rhizosphaerae]|uniref:Uncharacterized protein n=1 Tax=Serratia rhizosphaerae TaxID=2597702 RepID=A0ABX6GPM0_9GAMM|nr:hypothetical protein [Serratia rhizosphaerae]QHA88193.1 hypothetical protein FO014_15185 [Serratia rhizosphaerae]